MNWYQDWVRNKKGLLIKGAKQKAELARAERDRQEQEWEREEAEQERQREEAEREREERRAARRTEKRRRRQGQIDGMDVAKKSSVGRGSRL